MALVTKGGISAIDDRFIEIGIGIDNDSVFSAHFANHALELALIGAGDAGALPNSQTDFARPGERNKVDISMIDKVRADHRALAGEVIQYARRHAGFLENLHQHGAANSRLLGRLHNNRVAGDERGRGHSAEDRERKIPRRNDERDSARPVVIVAFFTRNVLGQARPSDPSHLLGIKETKIDCLADIAVRFRPRFADFENLECGELEATAVHDRSGSFQ